MTKYGKGWILDPEDKRDYQYDHIAFGAPPVDWESGYDIEDVLGFKIKTKDQNGSSSCVGQASAYLAYVHNAVEAMCLQKEVFNIDTSIIVDLVGKNVGEYGDKMYSITSFSKDFIAETKRKPNKKERDAFIKIRENERRRRSFNTKKFAKDTEMSAKSIYSQIYLNRGGAYLKDGVRTIVKWGILPERVVKSYEWKKAPRETFMRDTSWKTPERDEEAKTYQAKEYRIIVTKDIDTMAKAIKDGYGVLTGVMGSNSGGWTKEFPTPPKKGDTTWGHALYAGKFKMIDGKKYIGVKNSWGDIGDDGWQWLSEDWFTGGHVMNARVLIDKPNSGLVSLIDSRGKPRRLPANWIRAISKLIYKYNWKYGIS